MKTILYVFLIVIILTPLLFAQILSPFQLNKINTGPPSDYNLVPKNLGHYTAEDWATVIDTTWGEGLPTETKLNIFDYAYDIIDREFASFHGLNVNMDSLRLLYRTEIEAGVSRGRFAAIMNYFVLSFKEGHNWIIDPVVNIDTPLDPGVPLFVVAGWMDNTHFGATLTPLPDSSLLIIKALPGHPLGLLPGDIVLGYDGIPWKDLYKEILTAQLPFFFVYAYGTAEKAFTHDMLKSAGMNWHLFDTLDVVKYSSGDTMHYPTASLAGQSGNLAGNEQLKIPGVPFPDINWEGVLTFADAYKVEDEDKVSWGIVDGTNIGYIYVYAWTNPGNISEKFYQAVDSLMNYHKVEGLIFDGRLNFGGNADTEDKGLSLLFNSYIETIAFDQRCGDPNNHFQMCSHFMTSSRFAIQGDPSTFFDRPIAVLTGPGGMSMGDLVPLKMTFHPMVRVFGKPTSGAFSWTNLEDLIPSPGWMMSNAEGNAYLVSDPGNYLSRTESHVDEEVWLTQEDVAKGEDTVVKRAIEWIQNLAHAHDVTAKMIYANPDTAILTAYVENPNQHELSVEAVVRNADSTITDNLNMFDDGLHGDGVADDNIWGNFYLPTPVQEQSYTVSVTTNDLTEETSRTLPNVAWFTTIGPLVVDSVSVPIFSTMTPDRIAFDVYLRNESETTTAENVVAIFYPDTTEPCYMHMGRDQRTFGDIEPGQTAEEQFTMTIHTDCLQGSIMMMSFTVEIFSGGTSFWVDTYEYLIVNDIEGNVSVTPVEFNLEQNYPNPFNPVTMINYQLPVTSDVEMSIYNLLGQKVATLVDERQQAGYHQIEWDASGFASGIYYFRIEAGEFQDVKKMILIR